MAELQHSLSVGSEASWSSESDVNGKSEFSSPEEELLYYARNGFATDVQSMLQCCNSRDIAVNINCKGHKKSNRGWTPLHLAAYFGHTAVVRALLEAGAEMNMINSAGDTPLHRAAYTGREGVVSLLLEFGADINVVNAEGHRPRDVARQAHVIKMLEAAASHEARLLNDQFLNAAATGNMELLQSVISSKNSPSMQYKDQYGNTALHHAALRGHAEVAVYLLQIGLDPDIRNVKGQTASDVASSPQMRQVLGVQPIKALRLNPQRFEGPLSKKSRFVGFKSVWVVLERGVLSYFQTRGDASTGSKRKGMKYLDEARLWVSEAAPLEIKIFFSDGVVHTVALESSAEAYIYRQKWVNALNEHIAFSTHYTHQGEKLKDEEEELMPLGTMQDSLQTSQAHQKILEKQILMLQNTVETLEHFILRPANTSNSANHPHYKSAYTHTQEHEYLRSIQVQATELLKTSRDMCGSLSHCMALFSQQEEVRLVQLKEQTEKTRVLQESLHALASEHHELERSLQQQRQPSMRSLRDDDEFYDCDDVSYGSPLPENFLDARSMDLTFDSEVAPPEGIIFMNNANGQRTHLPVPMFSRADFSVWSILKQCIGKELSKITMPVIFNEPLSFLQRITEYLEYAHFLQTAARTDDPVLRMQYVAAFAVSSISSNWERIGKPFNPLLGETYELNRPDIGFRMVSEQVSHHPPISAFHAEGEGYVLNGSVLPRLRFWGKSVEITPKGTISLSLSKYNEVYTWQNVNCCIHNVIVGKLWVEHSGTMEITNHHNKLRAVLNFKQCGWFGKDLHRVEGFIYGSKKVKLKALYGSWVLGLYTADVEEYENRQKPSSQGPSPSSSFSKNGSPEEEDVEDAQPTNPMGTFNLGLTSQQVLWKAVPRPAHSSKYFAFTSFAMTLNQVMEDQRPTLPPTDSRLRPDIRLLEEGNIDGAAEEKNRLEEKQRGARKDRKKSKEEWTPVWFCQGTNPHTGSDDWAFTGHYFDRQWSSCSDIF